MRAPRARAAHSRQRQRLIDACISALHIYGPSRTTVEKVVAIAKMSPGIVRFYFDSKAAMLVASLQFLSAEFEEQVLGPVSKLKQNPVAGLEALVDLYLDPEIASPRKVSVWYAFWGEASSRQEYYDICGKKDESFAAMVRELIGRLIEDTAQPQLDPGGIALGLIGALEILWQDFAFQSEENIDRPAAKRRCMAYLKSIFPGQFARSTAGAGQGALTGPRFAGWAYANQRAFQLERDALFHPAWQVAAHESQIARAGDFVAADLAAERVLVVRDSFGAVHALRNSCPAVPHALVTSRSGRFEAAIECPTHRFRFGLNGRRAGGATRVDLTSLAVQIVGGLVLVRSFAADSAGAAFAGWLDGMPAARLGAVEDTFDVAVAADWKVLVEQWLETAAPDSPCAAAANFLAWGCRPLEGSTRWSAQHYRRMLGSEAADPWRHRFLAPNQLLQLRPDGASILQVIPAGPGRCRLWSMHFGRGAAGREAAAVRYLASRLESLAGRHAIETAQSTQRGVLDFGYRAGGDGRSSPAVAWFRQQVLSRLPLLALERPPTDSE